MVCAASGMKLSSVAIMARLADFSSSDEGCAGRPLKLLLASLAQAEHDQNGNRKA